MERNVRRRHLRTGNDNVSLGSTKLGTWVKGKGDPEGAINEMQKMAGENFQTTGKYLNKNCIALEKTHVLAGMTST